MLLRLLLPLRLRLREPPRPLAGGRRRKWRPLPLLLCHRSFSFAADAAVIFFEPLPSFFVPAAAAAGDDEILSKDLVMGAVVPDEGSEGVFVFG